MGKLLRRYWPVIAGFVIGLVIGFVGYARLGPSAVSLPAEVQSALLLLLSVTVAATVGAAAAIAGQSISASATERAASQARADEDRHRFASIKQGLYVELWLECDRHRREIGERVAWLAMKALEIEGQKPDIHPTETARRAVKSLELIAPETVVAAAKRLYEANVALDGMLWWDPNFDTEPPDQPVNEHVWDDKSGEWTAAGNAFIAAVQHDLRNPEQEAPHAR